MASKHDPDAFDNTTMEMLSANLPSNAFVSHIPDPRLERARQETERTNQLTPLLKEELRLRILSKRLEKGEPDIEINSTEPRSYELTEEEQAKRERRKAQNRRAAKKCREKRKMKTLSDAEKYRVVRDENQQLRNDVTYLRHKEAVFSKFCLEHILNGQCPTASSDEPTRNRLVTLLGLNVKYVHPSRRQTQVMSSPLGSRTHQNQMEALSPGVFTQQFFQRQEACTSITSQLPSAAAQAVYHAEQNVTAIPELEELPVHEISSLLPTEPDFSDHSMESSPPDLSPTSLFNAMSPTPIVMTSSGGASSSFFTQLTPSTSFSSNNTSSFSCSNDDIFVASHSGVNSLCPDSICSNGQLSPKMSASYIQEVPNCNLEMSRNDHAAKSYGDISSSPVIAWQTGKHFFQRTYSGDPNLNSVVSSDNSKPNEDGPGVLSRTGVSNVIINTANFNEFLLDSFITSYLKTEQTDGVDSYLSSCDGDHIAQIKPDSPLSPVSLSSPQVSLSPRSPCSISMETKFKDCSSLQFQPTAAGVSQCYNSTTPNPDTPAHHVVRRASSTTSVPSPHFNHQVSITLSPPPSVPSPNSSGVPESPSILPHYSPVSSATSDDCSPARFYDTMKDDIN
ncbi:unnamed protein product [Candidula unifasciata]|uniref:BZIP domain-containing protein n=1 Tax=Candidula unifasciata TaxID=100452 RepID=A0A8S3YC83_9EUPU|nr:unnamed protein product [Candidula unifasciata]